MKCDKKYFRQLMREYSERDNVPKIAKSVWERIKAYAQNSVACDTIEVTNYNITFLKEGVIVYDPRSNLYDPFATYAFEQFCLWVRDKMLQNKLDFKIDVAGANSAISNLADSCSVQGSSSQTYTTDRIYNIQPTYDYSLGTIIDTGLTPAEVSEVRKMIKKNECVKEQKENKNMFNFDFGKVNGTDVRYSTYGLAVKGVDGRYVAYDANSKSIMDVDVLNMPAGDFLFKMPVAIKDVKIGDIVIHNRAPMYVMETATDHLLVMDIRESTSKNIYPIKSPFGFNFITKVVSMVDMGSANADTPFGNMWPLLMANGSGKIDDILPMMMMANGMNMDMSNPMLMYFLMKDNKNMGDMALPLMMMAMNKPATPAPQQMTFCECGQPIK